MLFRLFIAFFTFLGIVFFVLLLGVAYLWFADPWNLRPLILSVRTVAPQSLPGESSTEVAAPPIAATAGTVTPEGVPDEHPTLSPEQEEALADIGIDASTLPATIPPAMEECFVEKLGAERVAAIKAGGEPTPLEVARALPCMGQ